MISDGPISDAPISGESLNIAPPAHPITLVDVWAGVQELEAEEITA